MLLDFFYHLRERGLPVSIQEHLTLLDALCKGIMPPRWTIFTICPDWC